MSKAKEKMRKKKEKLLEIINKIDILVMDIGDSGLEIENINLISDCFKIETARDMVKSL